MYWPGVYPNIFQMSLLAFGINHRSAPVALRERVNFPEEALPDALRELAQCEGITEAAILSTCNRTDLYCGLSDGLGDEAARWFHRYHSLPNDEWGPYLYAHHSEAAVRHIMRVASGLDSMILGEPQILGQVKNAYHTALQTGTIGQVLGRLFQQAFSVAKQVRTDTEIGSSPVSVAFAGVRLAQQIFGDLGEYTGLLIGAGETIELVARHLRAKGLRRLIIANRTIEGAHRLAARFEGYGISLSDVPAHLEEADIVFTSTASPEPVLRVVDAREALKRRKHRPMFIADIAVPRDVEAGVGELEDVYLYTVDDLKDVVQDGLRSRHEAALEAEQIIDTKVSHFMGWLGVLDTVSTIRTFRSNAEGARDEVLVKAQRMLAAGAAPEEALNFLANTLTNRLLHTPTVQLRRAASQSRDEIIEAARILLGLDERNEAPDEDQD